MTEKKSEGKDFSNMFQKWVRSNLTGSMRKTGAAGMSGTNAVPELEEVISEIRQSKADSPVSRMDRPKQMWLNAISTCNLFEIKKLLEQDSSLVNWKSPLDGTALHYAAREGDVKCLNYLLERENVDVNAQCGGWTPLHVAVFYSQRLFIRTLIETHKARNDIMDYSGKFPVDLLANEMKEDFFDLLSKGRVAEIRKDLKSLWNSRKMSVNCKRVQESEDFKPSEMDVYNQLLLSTLGRDRDYAVNMYQRLHRRNFARITPESLLEEIRDRDAENERAKKKSYSLKRGSVFKVPLLSYPPKNIGSGSAAMANAAASGLMKMGGVVKKGFQKQKDDRCKHESMNITKKNSTSTLNLRRGHKRKYEAKVGERHSIAEIEQLASRMNATITLGGTVRRGIPSEPPVTTLKSEGLSRHLSNLSDFVPQSSSEDGPLGESPSSSLSIDGGIQRTSSQSSLLARTQELLNQYLAPPSRIPSPSPPR